jgi:hypothetical protein
VKWVPSFNAVTVALGIVALLESVTLPMIVPCSNCAAADPAHRRIIAIIQLQENNKPRHDWINDPLRSFKMDFITPPEAKYKELPSTDADHGMLFYVENVFCFFGC